MASVSLPWALTVAKSFSGTCWGRRERAGKQLLGHSPSQLLEEPLQGAMGSSVPGRTEPWAGGKVPVARGASVGPWVCAEQGDGNPSICEGTSHAPWRAGWLRILLSSCSDLRNMLLNDCLYSGSWLNCGKTRSSWAFGQTAFLSGSVCNLRRGWNGEWKLVWGETR